MYQPVANCDVIRW